jgi:hypothetical protein
MIPPRAHQRRLGLWLVGLIVASVGCTHPSAARPPDDAPWYGDVRALAAEAAEVRGLTLTQTFEIVALDDEPFFELYTSTTQEQSSRLTAQLMRTFSAFALTSGPNPLVEPKRFVEQAASARNEQILAFYHPRTHRMVLRRTLPEAFAAQGAELRSSLLAHEVGHVLQDQVGAFDTEPSSFDAAISRRALLEGDATLTASLVLGRRKHRAERRTVERGRITFDAMSPIDLLRMSGVSHALETSSALVRELFIFPYLRGHRFAGDVYAAGGLALVDAALRQPPPRSDVIFRPQRWLDGRQGRLPPMNPEDDRLGLFLLRALIEDCLARSSTTSDAAKRDQALASLVEAYRDDVWTSGADGLVWSVDWAASETAGATGEPGTAREMMTTLAQCLGVEPQAMTFARHGQTTTLAVGSPSPERQAKAEALARAPRQAPPGPPFGPAPKVVPAPDMAVAFRSVGEGRQVEQRWVHDALGLGLELTADLKVLPNPSSLFTLMGPGWMGLGLFVDDAFAPAVLDNTLDALINGIAKGARLTTTDAKPLQAHSWSAFDAGWARGTVAKSRYAFGDRSVGVVARLIPLCDGNASLLTAALVFDLEKEAIAAATLANLHGTSTNPPVCREE